MSPSLGGGWTIPEPGWYADPDEPGKHRLWDGEQWTDEVRTATTAASDGPAPSGATAARAGRRGWSLSRKLLLLAGAGAVAVAGVAVAEVGPFASDSVGTVADPGFEPADATAELFVSDVLHDGEYFEFEEDCTIPELGITEKSTIEFYVQEDDGPHWDDRLAAYELGPGTYGDGEGVVLSGCFWEDLPIPSIPDGQYNMIVRAFIPVASLSDEDRDQRVGCWVCSDYSRGNLEEAAEGRLTIRL